MNKIINLSLKEKKILKLERVISDLRRGFPVIYNSGKVKWLFLATEFLNNESYSLISGDPFNLTLSDSRLNYLKIGDNTKHGFLSISQKPIATIQDLVFNIKAPDSNLEIDFTESEDIDNIHKFLIELEIVPSICFVPVESYDPELLEVDSELIGSYAKLIVEKLCFVTETNLHLSAVRPIKIRAYNSKFGGKDHYAIIVGNPELDASPLVRIHSSCYTGDLLGSLSCDCGDQLKLALKTMDESTEFHGGILIYLMQEGRGIGLTNKLRAYELQAKGLDTVEANLALGFPVDHRNFLVADAILDDLNVKSLTLLTNNPSKKNQLVGFGKKIVTTTSLNIEANKHNKEYLLTKTKKLGHATFKK